MRAERHFQEAQLRFCGAKGSFEGPLEAFYFHCQRVVEGQTTGDSSDTSRVGESEATLIPTHFLAAIGFLGDILYSIYERRS